MIEARSARGSEPLPKRRDQAMTKNIVMLHGANCGGWCFDKFRKMFEARGFTCHAPDLIGHGEDKADAKTSFIGVGMADYRPRWRRL
jgi:non-heme chloroperoxidase